MSEGVHEHKYIYIMLWIVIKVKLSVKLTDLIRSVNSLIQLCLCIPKYVWPFYNIMHERVNPFHATLPFLFTLKASENLWLSDAFSEYRKRSVAEHGLRISEELSEISIRDKNGPESHKSVDGDWSRIEYIYLKHFSFRVPHIGEER